MDAVVDRYRLLCKFHQKHPNLCLLKYDQSRSAFQVCFQIPFFDISQHRVVQECRGIILDSSQNWEVISWPYLKFFNYGEKYCHTIDWPSARVFEKLDGSLATLYWYKSEWHVSSSGVPDASKPFVFVRVCVLTNKIDSKWDHFCRFILEYLEINRNGSSNR